HRVVDDPTARPSRTGRYQPATPHPLARPVAATAARAVPTRPTAHPPNRGPGRRSPHRPTPAGRTRPTARPALRAGDGDRGAERLHRTPPGRGRCARLISPAR